MTEEEHEDLEGFELAEELYKSCKVGEIVDYITEIFSEDHWTITEYGTIFKKGIDIDHAETLVEMGITESKDSFEAFNTISLFMLRKVDTSVEYITGTYLDVYNFFTTAKGEWYIGMPEPDSDGNQFFKKSENELINFITDLSLDDRYVFDSVEQIANDEFFVEWQDFMGMFNFLLKNFSPTVEPRSTHNIFYKKIVFDERKLMPILSDMGKQKDDVFTLEEQKLIFDTPQELEIFKMHNIAFSFGGHIYEIYKNFGQPFEWVLRYGSQRHIMDLEGIKGYLETIKSTGAGLIKFNELSDVLEEEIREHVLDYKEVFSHFVGQLDMASYDPANNIKLSEERLVFHKFEKTSLGHLVSHDVLLANVTDDRYIRWIVAYAHGLKTWIDTKGTIYIQNSINKKIHAFGDVESFAKVLRVIYEDRIKTLA